MCVNDFFGFGFGLRGRILAFFSACRRLICKFFGFGFGPRGRILAFPACLRLICKSSFNPLTPVEISTNHHDGNNIVLFLAKRLRSLKNTIEKILSFLS